MNFEPSQAFVLWSRALRAGWKSNLSICNSQGKEVILTCVDMMVQKWTCNVWVCRVRRFTENQHNARALSKVFRGSYWMQNGIFLFIPQSSDCRESTEPRFPCRSLHSAVASCFHVHATRVMNCFLVLSLAILPLMYFLYANNLNVPACITIQVSVP